METTSVDTFCLPVGISGAIAITGGAPENAGANDDKIRQIVRDAVSGFAHHGLAILCNGTRWAVPLWATEAAIEFGLPLARIYPEKATKYLSTHDVYQNLSIPPRCCLSEWGDDSEVMIKLSVGVIFLAGGTGTLIEFAHWAKINESRVAHNEPIIYGVPIIGVGGMSDMVYDSLRPFWQDKIAGCLPTEPIQSGTAAAEFLLTHLKM